MLRLSLLADLKVFALSDRSIVDKPRLPAILQKASRNDPVLRLGTSSR